jgi:hypothetical protein
MALAIYDECLISFRKWVRITSLCPRIVGYQGRSIPHKNVVEDMAKKINYWIANELGVTMRLVNPVYSDVKPGYHLSVSEYFAALCRVHDVHLNRLDECISLEKAHEEKADETATLHLLLQGLLVLRV